MFWNARSRTKIVFEGSMKTEVELIRRDGSVESQASIIDASLTDDDALDAYSRPVISAAEKGSN